MPTCDPIGTVRSPLETTDEAPRQGFLADVEGIIEVDPHHAAGLAGLEAGDEVVVVWFADRADRSVCTVSDGRGVFSTRSPARPNPICLTRCAVLSVDGSALAVSGVDMLDGTPVLDVKPTVDRGTAGRRTRR